MGDKAVIATLQEDVDMWKSNYEAKVDECIKLRKEVRYLDDEVYILKGALRKFITG